MPTERNIEGCITWLMYSYGNFFSVTTVQTCLVPILQKDNFAYFQGYQIAPLEVDPRVM